MAEIVHHLVLGERDVILPRFDRMLREDTPIFASSATSRTGFAAHPEAGDFHQHVAALQLVRRQTLAFLQGLTESEWQRLGTTPTRGTLTIEAYAQYLARHDVEHLVQLGATRRRTTTLRRGPR